jgi:predicted DNA-binding protein
MDATAEKAVHTMSLRLGDAEYEALRAVSAATGQSINSLVGEAVRGYLGDSVRQTEMQARIADVAQRYQIAFDKLKDL